MYCLIEGLQTLKGPGLIDDNPRFADETGPDGIVGTGDENLRLDYASPAIDAASNDAIALDTLDLDADGDIGESAPFDLDGMSRRVDDASKRDTGLGSAPIVDMGAYESPGHQGCPADFNGDGDLNVLDFVAFQQGWQAMDPAADCDDNNSFAILDFICFQQHFVAGCP